MPAYPAILEFPAVSTPLVAPYRLFSLRAYSDAAIIHKLEAYGYGLYAAQRLVVAAQKELTLKEQGRV
jgi:hypothetical protein